MMECEGYKGVWRVREDVEFLKGIVKYSIDTLEDVATSIDEIIQSEFDCNEWDLVRGFKIDFIEQLDSCYIDKSNIGKPIGMGGIVASTILNGYKRYLGHLIEVNKDIILYNIVAKLYNKHFSYLHQFYTKILQREYIYRMIENKRINECMNIKEILGVIAIEVNKMIGGVDND